MKKATVIIILIGLLSTINGMQWCGLKNGLYVDVKTSVYKLYEPIETLTNSYIQIDSNKDYFEPTWAVVNAQEVGRCTNDITINPDLICN